MSANDAILRHYPHKGDTVPANLPHPELIDIHATNETKPSNIVSLSSKLGKRELQEIGL